MSVNPLVAFPLPSMVRFRKDSPCVQLERIVAKGIGSCIQCILECRVAWRLSSQYREENLSLSLQKLESCIGAEPTIPRFNGEAWPQTPLKMKERPDPQGTLDCHPKRGEKRLSRRLLLRILEQSIRHSTLMSIFSVRENSFVFQTHFAEILLAS